MSPDTIVLVAAISLFLLGYIYLLIKIPQLPYVGGFVGKWKIRVFGFLFGSLIVSYLFYNLHGIESNEWVEISLLAGLVAATGALALYAAGQADTNVKMAEEMRDARYDALRPIIDIVKMEQNPRELATQGYEANEGRYPKDLPCKLRNVGVGPAIELYSFIEDARGETCRWDFDTLPVANGKKEWGYTPEMRLLLMQRGNQMALVARYKDVYGNPFESVREVSLGVVNPGPLKVRPLPKKEHAE